MDALTLKVNLDCLRKDSQAIINAKVGEANGRKVVFTLYEGRTAFFVPDGASVIFRAQKPDGTILYNNCVIDDGKVEYTITSQTVAVAGVYACELQIVSDGRIIYSPYVTLNVMDNLYADTEVESSNEFTELENALNKIPPLEVIYSKYTKPEGGIPKADLANDVQASLNKADTALQEHQSLAAYRTAAEQNIIDNTKQDKLIAGENITIAADGKTISAIVGSSASISMRVNGGYIQYSTDNGATWSNLIAEADLKGDSGADGTSLYTTTQDSALETTPFDIIYITTNDRTIVVGDLILTPAGRLYRVTSVSTSFVDAAYTTSLRGPQGVKGDKGDTGPKGEQGPSGVSPTISLEETASGVMIDIVNSDGASSTGYVLHGQSAYEAARTGGYTDTQANFYADLAATQGFASGLANKQDTISDLETIRSGAAKGATALQAIPSTYRTAAAQDAIDNGLSDRISAIEGKEADWNNKYLKPTNGIPKTDLAAAVQTSLGKADTALQQHQSLAAYRTASAQDAIDNGKVDKVNGKGLSTNDYTTAAKKKVDAIPSNPKYTDTVYDDTAVRNRLTAIEKYEDVTLTADTTRINNVSYTAKYFQLLGIVFVRIYGKIKAALNAGYDYDLFSIDGRVPDSNAALSVKCGKDAMAIAKTSSNGSAIQIRPLESGINGYDVYITGFWFV